MTQAAALVLEDGRIFHGTPFGAVGESLGEVVFCTGMTGYQETLTDPSYHRQIVVATAPQIGNTGWNDEDDESQRIWVAGYVVRDPARVASNWRSVRGLDVELARQGVVGAAGMDTRAVTRHVRQRGAMRAGLFSGKAVTDEASMVARVRASASMMQADLASEVSTPEGYVVRAVGRRRFRVVALDLGIKSSTPRMLAARGIQTHVLPVSASIDEVLRTEPDGVLLSNGPGDPAALGNAVALTKELLARRVPLFGICLGHQLLGRALGLATYKLRYGHHGINVPVVDVATGQVAITAQNHGFALEGAAGQRLDTPFGAVVVSHYCPNDGTVEGLRCADVPAFAAQYHPEAAAGPHDTRGLFDEFMDLMEKGGHG